MGSLAAPRISISCNRVEKEGGRSRSRTGQSGGLSRGWAQGTGAIMGGVSGTVRGERGERGLRGQWGERESGESGGGELEAGGFIVRA